MKYKILILAAALLTACEAPMLTPSGNVTLTFSVSNADAIMDTRATSAPADYFSKLNIMLFDGEGNRSFSAVKTQLSTEDGFGKLTMNLTEGIYTLVAVGHSSAVSATIKSPQMVQFTAKDGRKLTDTFCVCQQIVVGGSAANFTLPMYRVGAMIRFEFTDTSMPASLSRWSFTYTGGSANFNPTTLQGTTKSTQTELRDVDPSQQYDIFTFPYLAEDGTLKVTISALTDEGDVIQQRTFTDIPVTRNRIALYRGRFFSDDAGDFTHSSMGLVVNGEWGGIDHHTF